MELETVSEEKKIVNFFLNKNILISYDILQILKEKADLDGFYKTIIEGIRSTDFLFLNKDLNNIINMYKSIDINWFDLEKSRVLFEKGKNKKIYEKFLGYLSEKKETPKIEIEKEEEKVKIITSYNEDSKKRDIQDFVQYFNARYKAIEKILKNRQEMRNITSINRLIGKKDKENISIIGLVKDKRTTKNNNLILTVEDPTSSIKVLVNKNKPDLFEQAKEIVLDEVIGVVGVNGENIVFANNILWPDIPTNRELKKSSDEAYAIFLSDLHVGSKNFLPDDFNKFIKWIRGEIGNEKQKEISKKVRYIFILGDLVDGCGIYPEQDKELITKDIYQQYEECANLLKQIPSDIHLIICPGNHDAMRIAEPQPPLYRDFAGPIYRIKNAIMVSNPSLINIHSSKNFSGFDVLLYHGYSFDFFVANCDSIRNKGGYNRADLIMKFLLKRRHLAPTHTSNLYIPDVEKDPLVIETVPDFFATGHIHKSIASNYRNITMICGSCWQSKTTFQEKVGHNPEPSRVPIVNLQTRDVKILRFGS